MAAVLWILPAWLSRWMWLAAPMANGVAIPEEYATRIIEMASV